MFYRVKALGSCDVFPGGFLSHRQGYRLSRPARLLLREEARSMSPQETIRPVRVRTSFLGAHSIPPEYKDRAEDYIDEICIPTLRAAHAKNLVDAVDGFCEGIAFSPDQIARVFDEAARLQLPVKLHAEQLSHLGGTALAASRGALSADHVEYANDDDANKRQIIREFSLIKEEKEKDLVSLIHEAYTKGSLVYLFN